MHKDTDSTTSSTYSGTYPATGKIPTVTITLDEYRELVKGKTIAETLLALIRIKLKSYGGIKHEELELLEMLYNKKEGE